jgi:hypothetical protein
MPVKVKARTAAMKKRSMTRVAGNLLGRPFVFSEEATKVRIWTKRAASQTGAINVRSNESKRHIKEETNMKDEAAREKTKIPPILTPLMFIFSILQTSF